MAAAIDHDVGRLQITVQHALVVGGGETGAKLLGDLHALVAGQSADAAQQDFEVLAVDVFHRQKVLAVNFADVVHAAHVGVRYLAGEPHLGVKVVQPLGILGQVARQKLQRDGVAQFQIVGPVDFAHAPFADQRHDAIAVGDFRAGQEAAVIGTAGKGGLAAAVRRGAAGGVHLGRGVARQERSAALGAELARIALFGGTGRTDGHGEWIVLPGWPDVCQVLRRFGRVKSRIRASIETNATAKNAKIAKERSS